ncbi:unnamed protein product [Rhizophagus irregularis]|nr:unnamed protein product [Rhizophagus irregularis]
MILLPLESPHQDDQMVTQVYLQEIKEKFVLNDVIIYSKTFEKHIQYLKKFWIRYEHFIAAKLQFLSHVIGKKDGKPDSEKVDKMVNYPKLENCEEF